MTDFLSELTQVTDKDFEEVVLQSEVPVIVDYSASWSTLRTIMQPMLRKMAGKFNGRLKVVTLDFEDNNCLVERFQLWRIPRLLFFKNGRIVDEVTSAVPETCLEEKLGNLLNGR